MPPFSVLVEDGPDEDAGPIAQRAKQSALSTHYGDHHAHGRRLDGVRVERGHHQHPGPDRSRDGTALLLL